LRLFSFGGYGLALAALALVVLALWNAPLVNEEKYVIFLKKESLLFSQCFP